MMSAPMTTTINTMYVGTLAPLGPDRVPSGIFKRPAKGPWHITRTGIVGDQQGDARHHGGPEKAVHHYPYEHYAAWIEEDPGLADSLSSPPAFGENLSTLGITEETVHIGDIYRVGGVILQVSQGRQPCWKLNARFNRSDMAWRVQMTGRTGWYYRVLREGWIETGDEFVLVERPRPKWSLARVIALLYRQKLDIGALADLANVPELAASWRDLAARRVATRSVEDWTKRLGGKS